MPYVPTGGGGSVAIGGTVTSATAGSVFFAGALGVLAQNNTAFQWVDADTKLKLTAGAATKTPLEINLASAQSTDAFQVKDSSTAVVAAITKDGYIAAGNNATPGPSIFNVSDTDTGICFRSPNELGIFIGGKANFTINQYQQKVLTAGASCQFGWSGYDDGSLFQTADTGLVRGAAAVVKITDAATGGGGLQLQEMTAPTAPASNNAIIFAEDNGSGKTRVVVRFPTGSDVVLATEA